MKKLPLLYPLARLSLYAAASLDLASAAGWTSVPLGGGGFVTGLTCNSNASAIYCRTDVGGAFRWVPAADATNGSWVSLSDAMVPFGTANASGLMGVESIVPDPSNLNRVYLAANGRIWISDDKGVTWNQVPGSPALAMDGNAAYKECGERLSIDPNNPDIIWYGSRQNGLQKAVKQADGTWLWSVIPSTSVPFGQTTSTTKAGISFVGCDKNSGSTIVYAGVYDNTTTGVNTGGIYRSTDLGTTWSKVPVSGGNTLTTPVRGYVSAVGNLYLTAGTGGVFKLVRGAANVDKLSGLPTGVNYVGLAVDSNQGAIYVCEGNWAAQYNRIWQGANGGSTWTVQGTINQSRQEPDGTKSLTGYWFGNSSAMLANPTTAVPNELWVADFFGVSRTRNSNNLGGTGANWNTLQKGQEETVVLSLKNGATGPRLMTGVSDVGGFRYNDITTRPSGTAGNVFNNLAGGNITSLDFSEANTNVWAHSWVESDGNGGTGATSKDGGANWTRFGQLDFQTLYNSPTAGWETFDVGPYLTKMKAANPNAVVTLVVRSSSWQTPNYFLHFSSKEGVNAPQLVLNGSSTLVPTADAMVIQGNPTTNYGGHLELQAQDYYGGSNRWAYIKFDLSTAPSVITSANLRLYRLAGSDTTNAYATSIYAEDDNSWTETGLNWNTRPLYNGRSGIYVSTPPAVLGTSTTGGGGRVAVSSTDPNTLVWVPIGTGTVSHYSRDRGVTWTASTGGPGSGFAGIYTNGYSSGITAQPLTADRVNGKFYLAAFAVYESSTGGTRHNIYSSSDGGASWTLAGGVSTGSYNQRSPQLVAAPVANDVWLCDDAAYNGTGGGLWHSTAGGSGLTKLAGVPKVTAVSFGKPTAGSGAAYAVYIYGYVGTTTPVKGVYRSDNYGSTWTKLADPTIEESPVLAGDRQNENSVFLGTGGRGVFHFTP